MTWRQIPPVFSPVAVRCLLQGGAAVCGARVSAKEATESVRSRFDAHYAVLTDSGTSALTLALRLLVPPGGTVAYPGYACIDLTTAAVGAGVRVRLYDVDPQTLSPDIESLRQAIARGVDAIVVAYLYGYPADIQAVMQLASSRGIPVIEDSAQAAGATIRGERLGGVGDISVFSFGRGKGTTTGSGGAILLRRKDLSDRLPWLRRELAPARQGAHDVSVLAAQSLLSHSLLYRIPASMAFLRLGEMVYHPPRPPRAMSAAAMAILPSVLANDAREVEHRRARAKRLLAAVNGSGKLRPIGWLPEGEPGFLRLAVVDYGGGLMADEGVGAVRGYPMTLDQHVQLRPLLTRGEKAGAGSALLRDRLFTLPTHSRVGTRDEKRLLGWLAARS